MNTIAQIEDRLINLPVLDYRNKNFHVHYIQYLREVNMCKSRIRDLGAFSKVDATITYKIKKDVEKAFERASRALTKHKELTQQENVYKRMLSISCPKRDYLNVWTSPIYPKPGDVDYDPHMNVPRIAKPSMPKHMEQYFVQ